MIKKVLNHKIFLISLITLPLFFIPIPTSIDKKDANFITSNYIRVDTGRETEIVLNPKFIAPVLITNLTNKYAADFLDPDFIFEFKKNIIDSIDLIFKDLKDGKMDVKQIDVSEFKIIKNSESIPASYNLSFTIKIIDPNVVYNENNKPMDYFQNNVTILSITPPSTTELSLISLALANPQLFVNTLASEITIDNIATYSSPQFNRIPKTSKYSYEIRSFDNLQGQLIAKVKSNESYDNKQYEKPINPIPIESEFCVLSGFKMTQPTVLEQKVFGFDTYLNQITETMIKKSILENLTLNQPLAIPKNFNENNIIIKNNSSLSENNKKVNIIFNLFYDNQGVLQKTLSPPQEIIITGSNVIATTTPGVLNISAEYQTISPYEFKQLLINNNQNTIDLIKNLLKNSIKQTNGSLTNNDIRIEIKNPNPLFEIKDNNKKSTIDIYYSIINNKYVETTGPVETSDPIKIQFTNFKKYNDTTMTSKIDESQLVQYSSNIINASNYLKILNIIEPIFDSQTTFENNKYDLASGAANITLTMNKKYNDAGMVIDGKTIIEKQFNSFAQLKDTNIVASNNNLNYYTINIDQTFIDKNNFLLIQNGLNNLYDTFPVTTSLNTKITNIKFQSSDIINNTVTLGYTLVDFVENKTIISSENKMITIPFKSIMNGGIYIKEGTDISALNESNIYDHITVDRTLIQYETVEEMKLKIKSLKLSFSFSADNVELKYDNKSLGNVQIYKKPVAPPTSNTESILIGVMVAIGVIGLILISTLIFLRFKKKRK